MGENIKYRIASLFSGCGGLDLGFIGNFKFYDREFKRNPMNVVFANDIDNDAVTCYNSNGLLVEDGHFCRLGDIRTIPTEEIPDFDILLAGFPCQPFSNAGARKGVNDSNGRGTLFEECERILRDKIDSGKAPIAFVFENVRGILSSKMESGVTVPEEIRMRMEKLGYQVSVQLVCASNYGVPQKRYRCLIVGVADGYEKFDFQEMLEIVKEENLPSEILGNPEKLLLGSLLFDMKSKKLEDNDIWEYTKTTYETVNLIGGCEHGNQALEYFNGDFKKGDLPQIVFEGRSWKNIPPEKLSPRFRKIYDNPKKYHAPKFFRRFAFGEINGTITASAQPENCGITHPVENRRYTVREIARIQSFPDDYKFGAISLQSRYKVIGNAVPPILGWVLAQSIIKHLMNK